MRRTSIISLLFLLGVAAFLMVQDGPSKLADSFLIGQVKDDDGPLAGATVRFKGSADSALTDHAGLFHLLPARSSNRITASKAGYFIAGAPRDTVPLQLQLHRLPDSDNPSYDWVDPAPNPHAEHNCANCHRDIYREWKNSGHARSANGRQFRDLYTGDGGGWGLLVQHPDGRGVCTSCHAQTVKPGDPALLRLDQVSGVAAKGVHCDYCHKVSGIRDDEIGLAHGRDVLTLLRPSRGQLFFGPLDDVDRGEDAYSAFYKDSRYCAACHEGVVFGVHVYSTYSEWLDSSARRNGQGCQDCHLKPTGQLSNIAPGKGGIERDPFTLANHRFFDGSREEMLRRCLRVSLQRVGQLVTLEVRVEGVGHRVPTGFIDRNLVLLIEGRDASGQLIQMVAGPRLPAAAGAERLGKPGRLFAKLLRDEEGQSPAPFWKARPEPEDTRLTPGQTERLAFQFAKPPHGVRVRILHRRFWTEIEKTKGWPSSELVVFDREWLP